MKKYLHLLLVFTALLFAGNYAQAQNSASIDCNKTCEITKEIGEGVFLGVQIQKMSNNRDGIFVLRVIEGTQAEAMGIKRGDIILSINNVKMTSIEQLQGYVKSKHKGFEIEVDMIRKGESLQLPGEFGYEAVETITERICCDKNAGVLELDNFTLYPNPSNGIFNVNFEPRTDSPLTMRIVNVSGQVVYEKSFESATDLVREQVNISKHRGSAEHVLLIEQDGKLFQQKVVMVN